MADQAQSLLAAAAAQVNAGDYAAAWDTYMAALRAEPGSAQAWLGLGLTAALQRVWDMLSHLADRRQDLIGDGFAYFHDVMTTLMSYGLGPLVEQLGAHLSPTSPYLPSQLYYAGCARLLADDEDGAFACFNRLKPLLEQRKGEFPIGPEDRFNIAWRQATLVEDGDYPDHLDAGWLGWIAGALPAVETVGRWGDEAGTAFTLLAACDGRYLERFGVDYLRSAARWGEGAALHLHVAEPEAAAVAAVAALAEAEGLPLTLTTEPASPWRSGAYYASVRFLVAAAVMAQHDGKPLMVTDIDIAWQRPAAELAALARPFAFASFVHESGIGPASRLPAVWTWFAGDDGRAMLEALRRTILSKLEIRWPHNWMLDQAALMTARRWLRRHRPDVAIAEINRLCGRPYTDFLECRGDEDDKAALIRAAGQG